MILIILGGCKGNRKDTRKPAEGLPTNVEKPARGATNFELQDGVSGFYIALVLDLFVDQSPLGLHWNHETLWLLVKTHFSVFVFGGVNPLCHHSNRPLASHRPWLQMQKGSESGLGSNELFLCFVWRDGTTSSDSLPFARACFARR